MTDSQGRTRRRYRRRTVRVMVEYLSDAGPRCESATTLGAGGLFVDTDSPSPEGSILKLRFQLTPNGESYELEGRVAWAKFVTDGASGTPGMGLEFTDRDKVKNLARELEGLP